MGACDHCNRLTTPTSLASTSLDRNTNSSSNTLWSETRSYDAGGRLSSVFVNEELEETDNRDRTISYVSDALGQVLSRVEQDQNTSAGDPKDLHYYFDGMKIGDISNNGTSDTDYATAIQNRYASSTSTPWRNNGSSVAYADFDQSYDPINPTSQGASATGSRYTVRDGDSLRSIARNVWGDETLWYIIADANALTGAEVLTGGTTLLIPAKVTNVHNNADTFRVYDPNDAIGSNNPANPAPKPPKKNCAIIGQILIVAIAVAVTALTAGAAAAAIAPGIGSISGGMGLLAAGKLGVAAAIGIGVASGAAGSIVSQGFGVATGLQDKFSWKGVAMSALAGGVSGGLNASGAFRVVGVAGESVGARAAQGMITNATTQGVALATGLQNKFSWAGVAAAGVVSGVGGASTRWLKGQNVFGNANRFYSGMASGIAGAATRSLITGTSFGDNLIAVLPDVIGTTIGSMIAEGVASRLDGAPRTSTDTDRPEALRMERPDLVAELEARGATLEVRDDGSIDLPGYRRATGRVSMLPAGSIDTLTSGSDMDGDPFGGWLDPDPFVDTHPPSTWRPGLDDGMGVNFLFDDGASSVYSDWIDDGNGAVRIITSTGGGSALYLGGTQRYDALGLTVSYGAEIQPDIDYAAAFRTMFGSSEPRFPLLPIGGGGTPPPTLWQRTQNIGDAMWRITIGPGSVVDRVVTRNVYRILSGVGTVLDPGAMMAVEQATAGVPQTRLGAPILRGAGLIGRGARWASGLYFESRAAAQMPVRLSPPQTVTLYRVDDVQFAPRIAADGSIPFVATRSGDERTLFINIGQPERAAEFAVVNRGGNATITAVEVDASIVPRLRGTSVLDTSEAARLNPFAPLRVDVTKAPDQFGLRTSDHIQMLRDAIRPGTARVVDPRTLRR
jgi:LysM repeat protein